MDQYIEENFKVFSKNFESIQKMFDLKMDKTELTKLEAEFKKKFNEPLENLRKLIDSKADLEWVKKMLAKLNNLLKEKPTPQIKSPEPKNDGAYLTKVPVG